VLAGGFTTYLLNSVAVTVAAVAVTVAASLLAAYVIVRFSSRFLFPLILTQSSDRAVLPLALTLYRGQFGIDVPAAMAAVVLARRQLIAGLTAGFSK